MIKGFEVMRALRKGQAAIFNLTRDIRGEARIVERAFGIGPSVLRKRGTARAESTRSDRLAVENEGLSLSAGFFCNSPGGHTILPSNAADF